MITTSTACVAPLFEVAVMSLSCPVLDRLLTRLLRIIGAPLLLVLLSACSGLQLAYNNAPSLGYWWLDSYFDFTAAQSEKVQTELTSLHDWHRKNELPRYVQLLQKWQRMAPTTLTPEQMCDIWADVRASLLRLSEQAEPGVVALAPMLGQAQFEHLANSFDKRNRKWRDEWLDATPAQRQKRQMEFSVERAEMFYGTLDDAQLALLRSHFAAASTDFSMSYHGILQRQQDMLQTLRSLQNGKPRETHVKAEMRALFERALNPPDPLLRQQRDILTTQNCKLYSALHNSTSAAQRQRAVEKLKDYEMMAQSLASVRP
jgi:hypothetical protein